MVSGAWGCRLIERSWQGMLRRLSGRSWRAAVRLLVFHLYPKTVNPWPSRDFSIMETYIYVWICNVIVCQSDIPDSHPKLKKYQPTPGPQAVPGDRGWGHGLGIPSVQAMLPMLPRCGAIEVAMKELEEQDLKKKHQVTPGPYISYMGSGCDKHWQTGWSMVASDPVKK